MLLLLSLAAMAPGSALGDKQKAQHLYDKGQVEFSLGHFLDAAKAFESAFHEEPRAQLLWNAAQAYRRQFVLDGEPLHLRRAIVLYQNFGDLAGDGDEKEDAREAERAVREQLSAFEKGRGTAAASTPAPTATPSPASAPEKPLPGPVVASATPSAPAPAPSIPPEPASPLVVVIPPGEPGLSPAPRRGSFAPGAALLAIGVAAAGGGGVLAWLAHVDERKVETSGTPMTPAPWADWIATDKEGRTFATTSYVLFGVGGAAAVVGAVLLAIRPGAGPASGDEPAKPQVFIAPTLGGLVVGGTLP